MIFRIIFYFFVVYIDFSFCDLYRFSWKCDHSLYKKLIATFWSWKYNNLISFRIPKTIC